MKNMKQLGTALLLSFFLLGTTSCREKTTAEKVEDGIEEVGEELEDAGEAIEEEVEDATDGN